MNITIKSIAKLAGVSPSAVSKALNGYDDIGEETKKKIYDICKNVGYTPNAIARSLVKKSNNTIGLLIPDISLPIYPEIFRGADLEIQKYGCNLLLCDTHKDIEVEKDYIRTLMEKRVNGIIIAPVSSNIEHINEITRGSIPIVFVGGKVNDAMDNYITNDNIYGSRLAVEYLYRLGHRKLCMLVDSGITKTKSDRINGYEIAMREAGLEPKVHMSNKKNSSMVCGCNLANELLNLSSIPTAIFASNDMVALGVMEAAKEKGLRIPEDISLIGYDDIIFASLPTIMLTTISQHTYKIGSMAVELLFQVIADREKETKHRKVIKPELVERNSCKAI